MQRMMHFILLATTVVLYSKCKFCSVIRFKAKHLRGEYFEACCWKELFDCGLVTVVHELTVIKKLARKLSFSGKVKKFLCINLSRLLRIHITGIIIFLFHHLRNKKEKAPVDFFPAFNDQKFKPFWRQ